MMQTDYAEEET